MTQNKFTDLAALDAKIPQNMMMLYQGKPYILKAGLEYKATQVFGIGGYSLETDIVERTDTRIVVKATLTLPTGMKYSNYGEANKMNVNNLMLKDMLHLATTRAECRVLRMATACGYVSAEEMSIDNEQVQSLPTGKEKPTEAQIVALKAMGKPIPETQDEALQAIKEAV